MPFFSKRKFARQGKVLMGWSISHLVIALVAGAVLAIGIYVWEAQTTGTRISQLREEAVESAGQPGLPPDMSKIGGAFTLTSQDGKPVSTNDFPGKYLLVYFGYTNCPDMCPTGLQSISLALDQLKGDADKVQPLFVTVDPVRDTPERLKEYDAAFHPKIIGLTGSADQIANAARLYQVYYKKGEGDDEYEVEHSTLIYLMDPKGHLVTTFDEEADPAAIVAALRKAWQNTPVKP